MNHHAAAADQGARQITKTPRGGLDLWLWAALSAGALAIAGVFALLLAVSRIPGIETIIAWPVGFFHKGLVIHVVFSFVIWFLGCFAMLASLVTCTGTHNHTRLGRLGPIGAVSAIIATPLLFIPAFFDRSEASLNNYVPAIIDPVYDAGLLILFGALGLVALRLLANVSGRQVAGNAFVAAVAGAGLIYASALTCLVLAWGLLAGVPPSHDFYESLFWGGGHGLQFVNTALVIAAWLLLLACVPRHRPVQTAVIAAAMAILVLFAVPMPALYLLFEPFSAEQTQVFTNLQYALGPPAALAVLAVAAALPRPWPWRHPAMACLSLSVLLFTIGGILGLFVDGADTRTPAHYHGVIAGVTLAFMGVFYMVILPRLARPAPSPKWQKIQIHLFAWGQLIACLGLFIAGGHGAPRKVAGAAQGLDGLVPVIGLGMNGLGGLIAVIGGIVFIVLIVRALCSARDEKNIPPEFDS